MAIRAQLPRLKYARVEATAKRRESAAIAGSRRLIGDCLAGTQLRYLSRRLAMG